MSYRIEFLSDIDREYWNRLVSLSEQSMIFDTYEWGELLVDKLYFRRDFLIVYNSKGNPVAVWQVFSEALNNRILLNKGFGNIVKLYGKISKFIYLISDETTLVWIDSKLSLEDRKLIILNIINFFKRKFFIFSFRYRDTKLSRFFLEKKFGIKEIFTYIVSLYSDEELIWKRFENSARKSIRNALKNNISVRIMDKGYFDEYFYFVKRVSDEQNLYLADRGIIRAMFDYLYGKNFLVFNAFYDDKIISTLGILFFNKTILETISRTSLFARENKLYGGDLIKWEIIKWGISNGYKFYDLAGIVPPELAISEKEKNIYRFKKKWGGNIKKNYIIKKMFWRIML